MSLLKSFGEFLATGAALVVGYILYFASAVIITFIVGLPIAFGVRMILLAINMMFTNTIPY
jgi:hypothetical protein